MYTSHGAPVAVTPFSFIHTSSATCASPSVSYGPTWAVKATSPPGNDPVVRPESSSGSGAAEARGTPASIVKYAWLAIEADTRGGRRRVSDGIGANPVRVGGSVRTWRNTEVTTKGPSECLVILKAGSDRNIDDPCWCTEQQRRCTLQANSQRKLLWALAHFSKKHPLRSARRQTRVIGYLSERHRFAIVGQPSQRWQQVLETSAHIRIVGHSIGRSLDESCRHERPLSSCRTIRFIPRADYKTPMTDYR